MGYSATTYGLGAATVKADRSEEIAAEAQRRIKAWEARGIKISRDERLQIIAQVQAEKGLKPRFQEPMPKGPWWQFAQPMLNSGGVVKNANILWDGLVDQTGKSLRSAGNLALQPLVGGAETVGKSNAAIVAVGVGLLALYMWKKR